MYHNAIGSIIRKDLDSWWGYQNRVRVRARASTLILFSQLPLTLTLSFAGASRVLCLQVAEMMPTM